jgi:hypothetical protein
VTNEADNEISDESAETFHELFDEDTEGNIAEVSSAVVLCWC